MKSKNDIISELRKEIRDLQKEYDFQGRNNDDNTDPPLSVDEQNRISRKLERLDKRIELKLENIKLLKSIKLKLNQKSEEK